MRLRTAVALSIVSLGLGAGLVACFDLFHSTSGILDACELDADACGDAGTDFCSWDSGTAYTNAGIACTWLSTCNGVFEGNDFGECMVRAVLAYDCTASSNHVGGQTKAMWDALWRAKSCEDVARIVSPGAPSPCPPNQFGCNTTTFFECGDGGPPLVESCALWGQTCDPNVGCLGCLGCFDAGGEGGACAAEDAATCQGDFAVSCPAGVAESVNCAELLQQAGTCNSGSLTPSWGATSPCYVDAGDAGGTCAEGCSGTQQVTACPRGTTLTFDCTSIDAGCAARDGGPASCVFQ